MSCLAWASLEKICHGSRYNGGWRPRNPRDLADQKLHHGRNKPAAVARVVTPGVARLNFEDETVAGPSCLVLNFPSDSDGLFIWLLL